LLLNSIVLEAKDVLETIERTNYGEKTWIKNIL